MAIPDWFVKSAEHAIQQWKHNGKWYVVRHYPDANYPWCLDHVNLNGNGGGGAPFKTFEELRDYAERLGLSVAQQLTLGI